MNSSRTKAQTDGTSIWAEAVRAPWTAVCAVASVVLGPAADTRSVLDRANRAPMRRTKARLNPVSP